MATPNPETDLFSMFVQKESISELQSESSVETLVGTPAEAEVITVKDFFDFMKTAYQVFERLEGPEDNGSKINWDELTKLTVINHVIDQEERDLLYRTPYHEQKAVISKSDTSLMKNSDERRILKRLSCSEVQNKMKSMDQSNIKIQMLGIWTEANLNCKLNDVINEGILDSILPYLVGYKKPTKSASVYSPTIKKTTSGYEIRKPASFGAFVNERESRDRLGRRKSSIAPHDERRQEGDVEIHVCDEVKGLKKDFRCPQKLLVSKMGYFADVTAGQKLEDMDISVHCDIQIFDWLMRWVKRDTILVADWPLLDPHNVIPILVSASFLQMEPLLQDCFTYCHTHMNEIVKTSTNLACLSEALLTRLAAMYTNVELEGIKDRKDKILSRLFCKMILSLVEPFPETLRGHYATIATLYKCSKCNKLLGRDVAHQVPCQPSSMHIDRRGNVISMHTKDTTWNLNEYITWLYGELRSWRRVYWRLWSDCHFLRCQLCDSYFPVYQMEWCSHHEQPAHMFTVEGRNPLPAGRYPCCGERAYRFEAITRNTGCQFREHVTDDRNQADAAVMEIYTMFRDIIAMRPPQLMFPDRLTRIVPRDPDDNGRLQCKEVFWWEGIQLVPPRPTLGLLGKLYSSNNKFNPSARPESPTCVVGAKPLSHSCHSLAANCSNTATAAVTATEVVRERPKSPNKSEGSKTKKKGTVGGGDSCTEACDEQDSSSDESEQSADSPRSDEDAPCRQQRRQTPVAPRNRSPGKRTRVVGRQWVASLSARSNQDGQRRFEERAVKQMRTALARRVALPQAKSKIPPGGIYARLEAEWRERYGSVAIKPRYSSSARPRCPNKFNK